MDRTGTVLVIGVIAAVAYLAWRSGAFQGVVSPQITQPVTTQDDLIGVGTFADGSKTCTYRGSAGIYSLPCG